MPSSGTMPCPDCASPLSAVACGPGLLYDCALCGGQFVELAALRNLVEHHDRLDVGLGPKPKGALRAAAPVRYVGCPACGSIMNRRNFGGGSGVIVDTCAKHGTWLRSGDLPRVLQFVESGGLTRARQREAEARAAADRHAHAAERVRMEGTGAALAGFRDSGEPSLLEDWWMALMGG